MFNTDHAQANGNIVKQSKSKTQLTRSVHCKFNCVTVKYNGTQHGIYIILEVH